jgi:CheY-like chemotaxis protein
VLPTTNNAFDVDEIESINSKKSSNISNEPKKDDFGVSKDEQEKSRIRIYQVSESKKYLTESSNTTSNKIKAMSLQSLNWDIGLRFLVVDDTITNRKMTQKMLSSLGHSVDEAADGLEFLAKLNIDNTIDSYDVVLMDDNMPNMTGPEATKIARAKGYKGLIFGVTGNAHIDQIENFLNSGANEIFEKPLNLDKLKISIERLLNTQEN